MPEPRLMKNPNGGILNVDVSLLQLGLSRCRSIAEGAAARLRANHNVDHEAVYEEIIQAARETLHDIGEHEVLHEVEAELTRQAKSGQLK
jgi:hypothetical protein